MPHNLIRIAAAGFAPAGKWLLENGSLGLELNSAIGNKRNALYAFAVDGALTYIGKTTLTVRERMQRYKTPPKSADTGGSTNIKNNRNILAALLGGSSVEILVLCDQTTQNHGEFAVSLAAGLEDSLISELAPIWNGRTKIGIERVKTHTPRPKASAQPNEPFKPGRGLCKLDFQATYGNFSPRLGTSELSI